MSTSLDIQRSTDLAKLAEGLEGARKALKDIEETNSALYDADTITDTGIQAELDAKAELEFVLSENCDAIISALRLAAQAQEDRKDAERYRWLRMCAVHFSLFDGISQQEVTLPSGESKMADVYYSQETLDSAIDSAIAEEKGERT